MRGKNMAQVTVELGRLMKTNFTLFDFEYKFDDPVFKKELEKHVIEFYYDYEIGQETPDMFKRKFIARWNRIIGYYNDLYNTTLLTYNPLVNYSVKDAMEQLSSTLNSQSADSTSTGKGSSTHDLKTEDQSTTNQTTSDKTKSNTNSETNKTSSDYPQQPIAGGDFLSGETIESVDSNTSSENDGTNKSTTTGSTNTEGTATNEDMTNTKSNLAGENNTTSTYQKTIEGITGTTYQELISKQRDIILNIQNMVIQELKPCFILVF